MKLLFRTICLFMFLATNAFSQDIVQQYSQAFEAGCTDYAKKTPAEIADGKYEEAEFIFLTKFIIGEQIGALSGKSVILDIRFETVKVLAKIFSDEQFVALRTMTDYMSASFSDSRKFKAKTLGYYDLAAQYKNQKITEKQARKKLSKNPFK